MTHKAAELEKAGAKPLSPASWSSWRYTASYQSLPEFWKLAKAELF